MCLFQRELVDAIERERRELLKRVSSRDNISTPHKLSDGGYSILHDPRCCYDSNKGIWKLDVGYYNYIEVQIHGPVRLNHDVATLIMHQDYQRYESFVILAEAFARKNNCALQFAKLR